MPATPLRNATATRTPAATHDVAVADRRKGLQRPPHGQSREAPFRPCIDRDQTPRRRGVVGVPRLRVYPGGVGMPSWLGAWPCALSRMGVPAAHRVFGGGPGPPCRRRLAPLSRLEWER